jgi:hypothetical protein
MGTRILQGIVAVLAGMLVGNGVEHMLFPGGNFIVYAVVAVPTIFLVDWLFARAKLGA